MTKYSMMGKNKTQACTNRQQWYCDPIFPWKKVKFRCLGTGAEVNLDILKKKPDQFICSYVYSCIKINKNWQKVCFKSRWSVCTCRDEKKRFSKKLWFQASTHYNRMCNVHFSCLKFTTTLKHCRKLPHPN